MERYKLTLLVFVMCLLGSKTQAMNLIYEGSTLTITLDKGEYLYQHVEEINKEYYDKATKVVVKTKTSKPEDEETISNLTYLVPNDFAILNEFTQVTTMDLHSVNYLFSDISLKGEKLQYVRLRDGIKNIQASWFEGASAFEGAYSYSKEEDNGNAYCVYCNSQSPTGGKIQDIFNNLRDQFSLSDDNAHKLKPDNDHLYVLVNGNINKDDVSILGGDNLNYSAVDMSLLNATYVNDKGEKDYANLSLNKPGEKLKSIALPSNMDVIGNSCLMNCGSLTKIVIPDGVKSIDNDAFKDCDHITSINIPEGCTTIGNSAFLNTRLQAVKLPSTLKSIGNDAFTGNIYLASITFPKPADGVTLSLGKSVFSGCTNLRDIYITTTAPNINGQDGATFTNTQLGQDPNGNNLEDGKVTIDNYRTDGQDNPIFLHYPKDKGSEYGDNAAPDNRASTYTLTGADKNKYPKDNDEANKWYNNENHTGWAKFVFAAANNEPSIDVPDQYKEARWYTMCFPFNLTRKQIEDTFGSGTEVCNFQYVEKEQIGEVTVYSIRFNEDLIKNGLKSDGTPITPGSNIITYADKPYMIHPSQKPDNGIYQITDGDRWEYKEENKQSVKTDKPISFEVKGHTAGFFDGDTSDATRTKAVFQGNYEENKLIPYGVFFLGGKSGEECYKIEAAKEEGRTTGKLKQYTAYVKINDTDFDPDKYIADLKEYSKVMPKAASVGKAKIIFPSLWGEDDMSNSTTTAIIPVHVAKKPVDMENARIYNLQGQLVGTGAETLKSLHRGIYVMNGRKYVVR